MESGISDLLLLDFVKALFVMPFSSIDRLSEAVGSSKKGHIFRVLLLILLGIVIALIPTALVLGLLSFDRGFTTLLENLFSFSMSNMVSHIISLLFGIPVGMYLFGLLIDNEDASG